MNQREQLESVPDALHAFLHVVVIAYGISNDDLTVVAIAIGSLIVVSILGGDGKFKPLQKNRESEKPVRPSVDGCSD